MSQFEHRFPPGTLIGGRYRVHQRFEGGMSEVYQCQDTEIDRLIALKTLKPHLIDDEQQIEHFAREVLNWVQLGKHPNIVRCSEMNILDDDIPFMFLEWVSNERGRKPDLRGWLYYGALDLRHACDFAIDICRGMIHAGGHNLIHLDLKPDNVLISPGYTAKITDFGMSRMIDWQNPKMQNRALSGKGTPGYMAPEQWEEGSTMTVATDVYSFGCMFYEMLSGEQPFKGAFSTLGQQHRSAQPNLEPIPPHFRAFVSRCMEKSPANRYQNFTEVYEALVELYDQEFNAEPRPQAVVGEFTAMDYINRAMTYIKLDEYENALGDLNQAINQSPDSTYLLAYRGLAHSHLSNYEAAIHDLTRAKAEFPNDPHVFYMLGMAHLQFKEYEDVVQAMDRVIELDPNLVEALYHRGLALANLDRKDEAISDMTRAISLRPEIPDLYLFRGILYKIADDPQAALYDQTAAIQRSANTFAEAYRERAEINVRYFKRYAEALEDLKMHNRLNPDDAEAHADQGRICVNLQLYEDAILCFTRAIALDDDNAELYSERGQAYSYLHNHAKAIEDYEKAMELDPTSSLPYSLRGISYNQMGDHERAMADFAQAAQMDPGDDVHMRGRTLLYANIEWFEQGLKEITRIIIRSPNESDAYYIRAYFLSKLKRYDDALADIEKCIELSDSFFGAAYEERGSIHIKMGNYEAAREDFEMLLQRNPRNYNALIGRGLIFEKTDNPQFARREYKRAADLGNPNAAYYYNRLAEAQNFPKLDFSPLERVFSRFVNADSTTDLQQAVRELPYMVDQVFIGKLQEAVVISRDPRLINRVRRNLQALKRLARHYHR